MKGEPDINRAVVERRGFEATPYEAEPICCFVKKRKKRPAF
jgi:hypothetical protein